MRSWFGRHLVAVCCVICGVVVLALGFFVGFEVSRMVPYGYQVNCRVVLP